MAHDKAIGWGDTLTTYTLHQGDCLGALDSLDADSVDGIVTDPPAGISFMGRDWDGNKGGRDAWIEWLAARLRAARRVLKPGHYGLVWALPRTSHWTGIACEDAGFIVEDRLSHIFGSGFPKNKNKLKPAIEDWWLIRKPGTTRGLNIDAMRIGTLESTARPSGVNQGVYGADDRHGMIRGGNTQGRWPAHLLLQHTDDCVCVGVKRVQGTLNTPRNRVTLQTWQGASDPTQKNAPSGYADADGLETIDDWQCADGCPVAVLDGLSGITKSVQSQRGKPQFWAVNDKFGKSTERGFSDAGGASRFFTRLDPPFTYAPKSSKREKNTGLDNLYWAKDSTRESGYQRIDQTAWEALGDTERAQGNIHPTVKNQALCAWLIGLVSDPGDTVLDLFAGTASVGVAALGLGRSFIGIERNEDYAAIARARLDATQKGWA